MDFLDKATKLPLVHRFTPVEADSFVEIGFSKDTLDSF